jgi:hypothetical protein
MANIDLLNTIKSYFVSGARPSQNDFHTLIDATTDASFINRGVIDNSHLPTTIDLTQGVDSSITADGISAGTATVTGGLSVGQNITVAGNLTASGITTLNTARVNSDMCVSGGISTKEHHVSLGVGNEKSESTSTMIRAQLNNELMLDVFSFDPQAGKVFIPVKNGEFYTQDEVAGKSWVDSTVGVALDSVSSSLNDESNRAKAAEQGVSEVLSNRVSELTQADTDLQANIDIEKNRINNMLSGVGEDHDSFFEILDNIKTLDTTSSSSIVALSSRVGINEKNISSFNTALINTEEKFQSLVTPLQSDVAQETSRAILEEGKLRDGLGTEKHRIDQLINTSLGDQQSYTELATKVTTIETDTNTSVQSIESRLANHDSQIGTAITNVASINNTANDLTDSVAGLNQNLSIETNRATTKENELRVSITAETNRLNEQVAKTEQLEGVLHVGETINLGRVDSATSVHMTGHCVITESLWAHKAIVPSVGNDLQSGINFPLDPGGGGGDRAWIHYYAYAGEATVLEIGTSNDADDHIVFNAAGNVGVNTFAPSAKFHVGGDALATAWNISSDERLKTNVKSIMNPLDKINAIRGVNFDWLDQDLRINQVEQIGVIAQEVEAEFPQVVTTDRDGFKSVDYSKLVAPLIEAVKELSERVEEQQRQIEDLQRFL